MKAAADPARKPSHPLHLVLGLSIWAIWLSGVYGGLSVACAVAPPAPQAGMWNWVNGSLIVFTLCTAGGLTAAAWGAARAAKRLRPDTSGRERFLANGAAALYATAAVCTGVVGVPLLLLPPCL